jgi:hypothetical protein
MLGAPSALLPEAVTQELSIPEKINDSRETAPSKRIARIFGGVYSKTEHGPS